MACHLNHWQFEYFHIDYLWLNPQAKHCFIAFCAYCVRSINFFVRRLKYRMYIVISVGWTEIFNKFYVDSAGLGDYLITLLHNRIKYIFRKSFHSISVVTYQQQTLYRYECKRYFERNFQQWVTSIVSSILAIRMIFLVIQQTHFSFNVLRLPAQDQLGQLNNTIWRTIKRDAG